MKWVNAKKGGWFEYGIRDLIAYIGGKSIADLIAGKKTNDIDYLAKGKKTIFQTCETAVEAISLLFDKDDEMWRKLAEFYGDIGMAEAGIHDWVYSYYDTALGLIPEMKQKYVIATKEK